MLDDWVNEDFDPFAAPMETGSAYGEKSGSNAPAVTRTRSPPSECRTTK